PPGAVVRLVAGARERGLDLRALVPLVVARDRDGVGPRAQRAPPHGVVCRAAEPRPDGSAAGRSPGVEAGADGGGADEPEPPRTVAHARERAAVVRGDVVRVQAREAS